MPLPSVQHIRDISFQDHFLSAQGAAPKNGKIQVSHNTFDVTFVDGKVNAKFASGNWFTNLFRSSTLTRFTQTLQAQYDAWVNDQAKAGGGGDGRPLTGKGWIVTSKHGGISLLSMYSRHKDQIPDYATTDNLV